MRPLTQEPSLGDAQRHPAETSRSDAECQPTPPVFQADSNSGDLDSGNSLGRETSSEDSPPSAQEQCRPSDALESPIRGLIMPESPADSQVIAENMVRLLREDSPMCEGISSCWDFSLGAGGAGSLPDRANGLQSQPLDDVDDSASSSGPPWEVDSAHCAPESELPEEQTGVEAEQAAVPPGVTSNGTACPLDRCDADEVSQKGSIRPGRAASSLPDGAEDAVTAGTDPSRCDDEGSCSLPDGAEIANPTRAASSRTSAAGPSSLSAGLGVANIASTDSPWHSAEAQESCLTASGALPDVLVPVREPAAALQLHAAVHGGSALRLLPWLRTYAVQRQLLGGGIVLIALVAALRRRSGVLQLLRLLLRASTLYGETMQRLK